MTDEEPKDIDFGTAAFGSLVAVPIILVGMFTIGIPFAWSLSYFWNSTIAVWLGLPVATVWNMISLMFFVGCIIPKNQTKLHWKLQLCLYCISFPLTILCLVPILR